MVRLPQVVGNTWFNSKPLLKEDLNNKVVLVDFWTYSCVNCIRTIPYLRKWWQKYQGLGFVLIGVHTPEFEFEKDPKNVEKALKEFEISWPVVLDNEYINWNNFANHYWPAKYLADKKGYIVYTHFGEGEYRETEMLIQDLIGDQAKKYPLPKEDFEHTYGRVCFIPTPETYLGYLRGRLVNEEGYKADVLHNYSSPKNLLENSISLSGPFLAASEYVESKGKASLFLKFHATEVNLVLSSIDNEAVVKVEFNGKRVPAELLGKDVNKEGKVKIKEAKMYNILKSSTLINGALSVKSFEGNFQAYAFTFSGCI